MSEPLFTVGPMTPDMLRSAVVSDCGAYRYELTRRWDITLPRVGWIMLNPSTADAEVDDPTIRRCIGFAKAWGYGGIVVRNMYALRATDPKALRTHPDPIGRFNSSYLRRCAAEPVTVCAWGANADPVDEQGTVGGLIVNGVRLYHLGLTKNGSPRHPLYLKAGLRPTAWEVSA
jgi:hypothetical protein